MLPKLIPVWDSFEGAGERPLGLLSCSSGLFCRCHTNVSGWCGCHWWCQSCCRHRPACWCSAAAAAMWGFTAEWWRDYLSRQSDKCDVFCSLGFGLKSNVFLMGWLVLYVEIHWADNESMEEKQTKSLHHLLVLLVWYKLIAWRTGKYENVPVNMKNEGVQVLLFLFCSLPQIQLDKTRALMSMAVFSGQKCWLLSLWLPVHLHFPSLHFLLHLPCSPFAFTPTGQHLRETEIIPNTTLQIAQQWQQQQ